MAEAGAGKLGLGRIPYRVRVGVTGHRSLPNTAEITGKMTEVLATIRSLLPDCEHTPVWLTVVSPLAEGADRLVAHEVLRDLTADLEAVLPLPLADYEEDFPDSREEFFGLLQRAAIRLELPNPMPWETDAERVRKKAYRQVGRYIVDHSDLLIALWDGKDERGEGGTAEVVRYARKRGTPLLWLNTETLQLATERMDKVRWAALEALEAFNAERVPTFEAEFAKQGPGFLPEGGPGAMPSIGSARLCGWFLPYFIRADVLARRYQKRHHSLATPIFVLSALAVGFAGAQAAFSPEGRRLVFGEISCIFVLIFVVALGLKWRPSRNWIAYRFLAERLRSAYFLAAAGLDDQSAPQPQNVNVDEPSATWLSRAYVEVWKQRDRVRPTGADTPALRDFMASKWVEGQRHYHDKTSESNEKAHHRLEVAIWVLLLLTLAAPVLHVSELFAGDWPHWFSFLSITLPAVGAGVTGFGEQREFEMLASRYKVMETALAEAAERMSEAGDLQEIWSVARRTEHLMRQENRDWFGLMRFRDIGPHV